MKTLSITAFMMIPLFGDAMFASWKTFAAFAFIALVIFAISRYVNKKFAQWEKELEDMRKKELDDTEKFYHK